MVTILITTTLKHYIHSDKVYQNRFRLLQKLFFFLFTSHGNRKEKTQTLDLEPLEVASLCTQTASSYSPAQLYAYSPYLISPLTSTSLLSLLS